jgi:hypothetical protein
VGLKHFYQIFKSPSELNAIPVIVDLELSNCDIVNANRGTLAPHLVLFSVTELNDTLSPINLCQRPDE